MDAVPFHEALRREAAQPWQAIQTHRFVRDVEADRLPAEVFARYLSYEREFVETAVLIFGHAMLKAPDHEQRRVLIGVLHGLVEEQLPYFDSAFQELQASPLPRGGSPPAVVAFGDGMLAVAKHGSYEDILAAMLGAEWDVRHVVLPGGGATDIQPAAPALGSAACRSAVSDRRRVAENAA